MTETYRQAEDYTIMYSVYRDNADQYLIHTLRQAQL